MAAARSTEQATSPQPAPPAQAARHAWEVPGLAPLVAVAAAVLLYAQLLRGTPFHLDDFQWVYYRIPGYLDAFAEGQVPPRVFADAYAGGGDAFPHFYPPLSHWIATAFAFVTASVVWGVHLSFLLSVVLAALAMYALALHVSTSRAVALTAALAYTALPYHVVDVFARGALAEAWAFVWLPLIALGGLRCAQLGRPSWLAALSVTALLLSHTVMALYCAVLCGAAMLWLWRREGRRAALSFVAAGLAGAGMAAWYLLPMRAALPLVRAGSPEIMLSTWDAVLENAPRPGSALFLLDGLPWLLAGCAWLLARQNPSATLPTQSRDLRIILAASAVLTLFAYAPGLFRPVLPDAFAYIQFPWRVFLLTGFLSTVTLIVIFRSVRSTRLAASIAIAAFVMAGPFSLLRYADSRFREPDVTAPSRVGYTLVGDYLPLGISNEAATDEARAIHAGLAASGVRIHRRSGRFMIEPVQGADVLLLPIHFYPFYAALDDAGRQLPVVNSNGRVAVSPAPGTRAVAIRIVSPAYERLGVVIGALAALLMTVSAGAVRIRAWHAREA